MTGPALPFAVAFSGIFAGKATVFFSVREKKASISFLYQKFIVILRPN